MRVLEFGKADLIFLDIGIRDVDGMSMLQYIREHFNDIDVIATGRNPSIQDAVKAVQKGAENFLAKPLKQQDLQKAVTQLIEKRARRRALTSTRLPVEAHGLIGESESIQRVIERIERAAAINANVLIHGESGTGKELVARAIHYRSDRATARFVTVNCAAIPDTLLESELFGHTKGAFTGAKDSRAGFFQIADGGTIFLDEIGDASLNMQGKLLRVLQSKEIHVVGSSHVSKVDARIIAATHKDLLAMIGNQHFREDLYYRLDVIDIHIPPLRDRPDDILPLASHFLHKLAQEMGRSVPAVADETLDVLKKYAWPGNVRELENLIQRLLVNTDDEAIVTSDLPQAMRSGAPHTPPKMQSLAALEVDHIHGVLDAVDGNKTRAAAILGIDRKTLREKLKRFKANS